MWINLFIGVVALHVARAFVLISIRLHAIVPDSWHWISGFCLLGIVSFTYSKIPTPKRSYLRLDNRMRSALSGVIAGLTLGAMYLL